MLISVVVPNFNSGDKLVKNLPKLLELLKKSKLEYEVVVVDDASTDGSVTALSRGGLVKVTDYSLQLIVKDKNAGFGMTVDKGIRAAKGEIVFVLNAIDALPESPDYFKIMLAHFDSPKKDHPFSDRGDGLNVFSVGAMKKDEEDHGCGEIYFEKGFFLHRHSQGTTLTAWADGGSQALRREYYLKIGGFDPLYKFYWEDVDLGYRAWKAGYEVHFEPKAVLIHQKKEGPIAKYYDERQRRIMNLRNQMVFTYKNSDAKHLMLHCLWWPYHFAVAIKNSDGDWFVAYFQTLIKLPQILATRLAQKKVTKLADDQLLKLLRQQKLF